MGTRMEHAAVSNFGEAKYSETFLIREAYWEDGLGDLLPRIILTHFLTRVSPLVNYNFLATRARGLPDAFVEAQLDFFSSCPSDKP